LTRIMRTLITYMLSILFLLFFAETKVFAHTQHSQGNFTSQTIIQNNPAIHPAAKLIETKISQNTNSYQIQDFNPTIEFEDDDIQLSKQFDFEACFKLLSVVLVLGFINKGRRRKHFFYNKTILISNCKYIALRTIRI